MREFFKGWRRKAGGGLLVMACGLVGMWVRSLYIYDTLAAPQLNRQHIIDSVNGHIWWTGCQSEPDWGFMSTALHQQLTTSEHFAMRWSLVANSEKLRLTQWVIPYWLITVPLTLLSAYLLLWKPRKSPAKPVDGAG